VYELAGARMTDQRDGTDQRERTDQREDTDQRARTHLDRAHRRARERGVLTPLYALVRFFVTPILRMWFRMRISGTEHIPVRGAAIVAPNHKNFLDAFFVGIATHRHVRYMAKVELFRGPLGWLLLRLGAFPVRRGEADVEAMETARLILEQGGLLVVFPEGTRVEDPHALGSPHHGAGRLALATGAPIVPAAIAGTQKLWLGPVPKPRRVQLSFLPAIDPGQLSDRPDALGELIDRELWPAVQREYGRELARPGLILAALAAIGLGGGLLARRRARAQTRLLGIVEPLKVRRRRARRQLLAHLRAPWRRS
jgi:1-acyl-sn-glycerol-3-phosphate acyltransferase